MKYGNQYRKQYHFDFRYVFHHLAINLSRGLVPDSFSCQSKWVGSANANWKLRTNGKLVNSENESYRRSLRDPFSLWRWNRQRGIFDLAMRLQLLSCKKSFLHLYLCPEYAKNGYQFMRRIVLLTYRDQTKIILLTLRISNLLYLRSLSTQVNIFSVDSSMTTRRFNSMNKYALKIILVSKFITWVIINLISVARGSKERCTVRANRSLNVLLDTTVTTQRLFVRPMNSLFHASQHPLWKRIHSAFSKLVSYPAYQMYGVK